MALGEAPMREIVKGDRIPATKVNLDPDIDWAASTFSIAVPANVEDALEFSVDDIHKSEPEPYIVITSTSDTSGLPLFWHFNLKETGRYNRILGRWPFQIVPV